MRKSSLFSLGLIILATAAPAIATASADIVVDVAPPPARVESVPSARAGYVWAPGHWEWNGHFHRWASGTWIVAHGNSRWAADHWEQVGDRWHFVRGEWVK